MITAHILPRQEEVMSPPQPETHTPPEEAPPRRAYDPNIRGNPGDVEIPNRIFVKGFPKDATDDEIKNYFEKFGMVRDVRIVRDKSGVSKGYGFVTFDSQEVAEKVKEIEFMQHKDREIVIGPAKIRKKRPAFLSLPMASQMHGYVPMSPMQSPAYAVSPDGVWYQMSPAMSPAQGYPSVGQSPVGYSPASFTPTCSPAYAAQNPFEFPVAQQMQQQLWQQQVPMTMMPATTAPSSTSQAQQAPSPQQVVTVSSTLNGMVQQPTYCEYNLNQAMGNMSMAKGPQPSRENSFELVPTTAASPPVHYVNVHPQEERLPETMEGGVVYVTDGKMPMKTVVMAPHYLQTYQQAPQPPSSNPCPSPL